jgi:hypothetical protein
MPDRRHFHSALVFTGHMVDLSNRPRPRFPPEMESEASREIRGAINHHLERVPISEVIAISSLARGGDILFQEHAWTRNIAPYIVLPFEREEFVKKSVTGAHTGDWVNRFWQIWNRTPSDHREVLTKAANENPYEACNQRLLEVAQESADEITLIALFDGTADDVGGTHDLIQRVDKVGGGIDLIDARQLLARVSKPS